MLWYVFCCAVLKERLETNMYVFFVLLKEMGGGNEKPSHVSIMKSSVFTGFPS